MTSKKPTPAPAPTPKPTPALNSPQIEASVRAALNAKN